MIVHPPLWWIKREHKALRKARNKSVRERHKAAERQALLEANYRTYKTELRKSAENFERQKLEDANRVADLDHLSALRERGLL